MFFFPVRSVAILFQDVKIDCNPKNGSFAMKTPVKPSKDLTTSLPALNQIVIPPQPYDRLSITDPYRLEKNGNWKRPLPRRGRRGIVQEPFSAVLSILNEQSILTRYHSTMGSGSALRGHTKRTERPRRPTRRAHCATER